MKRSGLFVLWSLRACGHTAGHLCVYTWGECAGRGVVFFTLYVFICSSAFFTDGWITSLMTSLDLLTRGWRVEVEHRASSSTRPVMDRKSHVLQTADERCSILFVQKSFQIQTFVCVQVVFLWRAAVSTVVTSPEGVRDELRVFKAQSLQLPPHAPSPRLQFPQGYTTSTETRTVSETKPGVMTVQELGRRSRLSYSGCRGSRPGGVCPACGWGAWCSFGSVCGRSGLPGPPLSASSGPSAPPDGPPAAWPRPQRHAVRGCCLMSRELQTRYVSIYSLCFKRW